MLAAVVTASVAAASAAVFVRAAELGGAEADPGSDQEGAEREQCYAGRAHPANVRMPHGHAVLGPHYPLRRSRQDCSQRAYGTQRRPPPQFSTGVWRNAILPGRGGGIQVQAGMPPAEQAAGVALTGVAPK